MLLPASGIINQQSVVFIAKSPKKMETSINTDYLIDISTRDQSMLRLIDIVRLMSVGDIGMIDTLVA